MTLQQEYEWSLINWEYEFSDNWHSEMTKVAKLVSEARGREFKENYYFDFSGDIVNVVLEMYKPIIEFHVSALWDKRVLDFYLTK